MKTHSDLPFISIIIPVYNKCQFLDRCFNSIINSTYSDLEIIVVNDGSTDGSGELCEKYQKKDIRFKVIHQSNTGVSAARNKGLDLARGKWIYFADADDWIDNDAFKGIVTAILLHPEVDFIRAYCREIIGDKVYNPKIPDKIQVFGKEFFLQSGFMPGYIVSMFVRRDVIEKNNLRLSAVLDYKEDAEFIFRCVMNSDKILLYNKVFYNYFINDTSSSENLNLKKVTDHLTVAILMKKYSHFYDNLVVMKYVKHQLNHQLYLYFTEIRLIRDKSVVRAGKIRADILLFMRETNLKLSELSGLNLIFLFMGLIHIRLIFALHRIRAILNS